MTTQRPTNLQPVCQVPGCKEGAQILALHGTTAEWMRTCKDHSYMDLEGVREKLETFWPPADK